MIFFQFQVLLRSLLLLLLWIDEVSMVLTLFCKVLKVNFGIYPRQPLHPPHTSVCLLFPFGHTAPHQWRCCVLNTGCVFYEQFPLSLGWHCHANSLGILLKIKVVPVTSSLCLCMGPYKGGMITIMRYCLMRVSNTARNGDIFIKVEWLSPTDTV